MSDIVLDKNGENKGRVVLNNKLVYFGPIEVIEDPVIYTVTKIDGTETTYSVNIIKINNQGRLQIGGQSIPTNNDKWDMIALPKIIDNPQQQQELLDSNLPEDADGNEIQWVSYVMYDIFSSFPNNKNSNVDKDPKTVFGNELFQGFFNAEYNEDVMFNKANLKRLQRQTFEQLVIYFNALMETLDHIYTHSISSVVNPEKKLCLKDLPKGASASGASGSASGSSGSSGSSSASGSGTSSASGSSGEQLLTQIEKLYNEGKMKEIDGMSDKIDSIGDYLLATKINLYVTLSRLETGQLMLKDTDLDGFSRDINEQIQQINSLTDFEEKTKYTRLIFKILFYTYQDDTISKLYNLWTQTEFNLAEMDSRLQLVFNANSIKKIIKNNIDEKNRDTSQREADDKMAKYALEITAADKTEYEKEISETTAAAQKAKADLKWTLAELLFKRAYQLAVVYFGYDSEQEGAAKSAMEKFSELNNKHGSKLIKFVGNLKAQLEMPGSVYSEFLDTDNKEQPIFDNKKDIPKDKKDEIEAVIKAQIASRTTSKLFEVTPTEEIQKQLPGAIIGTLSGIISNMIIQMTLYIYIVNQLRIKEIDDESQGPPTMDNNEIILLFNILAGLKIAQQRIIELSAEQNQNNDDDDQINISDGTQVDSAFLNKLMGSVLASGSMLGVLAAVGGKKRRTKKKRRAKGLKSRRLNSINASNSINNSKNRRYKKGRGKGITRRELRKVKTSRKLRK
jgi:hypothetical protein